MALGSRLARLALGHARIVARPASRQDPTMIGVPGARTVGHDDAIVSRRGRRPDAGDLAQLRPPALHTADLAEWFRPWRHMARRP